MRTDKFLSLKGISTRRDARAFVKKNQIMVDGKKITNVKDDIKYGASVLINNIEYLNKEYVYFLFNKPKGVVSATKDNMHTTIIDLLDQTDYQTDLFPVGRLDIDTTGLIIVTNNGDYAHNVLSPKKHITKEYLANIYVPLSCDDIVCLENGVVISKGYETKPAKVKVLSPEEIILTISEGKFHQVKEMLLAVGNQVTDLKRISFGNITLPENLNEGEYTSIDINNY